MSITKPSAAVQAAQIERAIFARRRARRNALVELVREHTTPARKRGGARYGPAPAKAPHEGTQAPAPMRSMVREQIYLAGRGVGGLTRRQHRQYCRMALLRGADMGRGLDAKNRPTPKRGRR